MKTFTNELGNQIKLEVREKEINKVPGILIYTEGPNSLTENHITLVEAKELLDQLHTTIKQSTS